MKWANGGLAEFSGLVFNMTNSSGNETFVEMKHTAGAFYPMYDRCNKKGDPVEGCLHTELRYYDEDIIWMPKENHHIIYDPTGKKILERNLKGSLNYTRTPKEIGCRKHQYVFSSVILVVIPVLSVVTNWTVTGILKPSFAPFKSSLTTFVTVL